MTGMERCGEMCMCYIWKNWILGERGDGVAVVKKLPLAKQLGYSFSPLRAMRTSIGILFSRSNSDKHYKTDDSQ